MLQETNKGNWKMPQKTLTMHTLIIDTSMKQGNSCLMFSRVDTELAVILKSRNNMSSQKKEARGILVDNHIIDIIFLKNFRIIKLTTV